MYFGAVTFNARFPAEIAVFPAFTELWVVAIGASTVVVFLHSPVVTEVEVLVPPGVVPPSSVPEVEFNKLAVAVMDNDGLFPVVSTAEFVKEIFMEALALKLFTVIVPSSSVTPVGSVPVLFRREPFHVSSKPDCSHSFPLQLHSALQLLLAGRLFHPPFRKLSLAIDLYSEIALPLLFLLPFP
mgnify:CR=1 FL=1